MKLFTERITIPQALCKDFNLEITPKVNDAEYFFGTVKFLNEHIDAFENLKYVQLTSAGYDQLDERILESDIIISNARGVYSEAIAEYVFSYILADLKQHQPLYKAQEKRKWQNDIKLHSPKEKTILCLGTGSIAQEIAKIAKFFSMRMIGINSNGRAVSGFDYCTVLTDIKTLSQADYVVSSLPLNKHTQGILDRNFFLNLNENAMFVNVGRGAVVKEEDLLEIIDTTLSKVVLDVFKDEPLNIDSPLWHHEKVIVTPHISYQSEFNDLKHIDLLTQQLSLITKGESPLNQIKSR